MSAARQLQLAKRENFFSDPLFKDIWSFEDGDLQKRLETFKNKSALAIPGKADTAHNLQVRNICNSISCYSHTNNQS